jgi:hypothetical protein
MMLFLFLSALFLFFVNNLDGEGKVNYKTRKAISHRCEEIFPAEQQKKKTFQT